MARDKNEEFLDAARDGNVEDVKALLAAGVNVNFRKVHDDKVGRTALASAAFRGYTDIVGVLCEVGADVNARTVEGYTPLMLATQNGHPAAVKILCEAGADVNLEDDKGDTALMSAAASANLEMVDCLLCYGAKIPPQLCYQLIEETQERHNYFTQDMQEWLIQRLAEIELEKAAVAAALEVALPDRDAAACVGSFVSEASEQDPHIRARVEVEKAEMRGEQVSVVLDGTEASPAFGEVFNCCSIQ